MKKIVYLFFTISIFVFSHGAEKKDLPGAWKLVESSWNGQFFDIRNPSPIKVYTEGYVDGNYHGTYFVSFYNQKGEAGFNQGFYKLDNGTLVEYINNSTDSNSLNNKVSFMPNFMGDKMSFIQTIEYPNGDVLFERWERLSCEIEKCYKLRSRKD